MARHNQKRDQARDPQPEWLAIPVDARSDDQAGDRCIRCNTLMSPLKSANDGPGICRRCVYS